MAELQRAAVGGAPASNYSPVEQSFGKRLGGSAEEVVRHGRDIFIARGGVQVLCTDDEGSSGDGAAIMAIEGVGQGWKVSLRGKGRRGARGGRGSRDSRAGRAGCCAGVPAAVYARAGVLRVYIYVRVHAGWAG